MKLENESGQQKNMLNKKIEQLNVAILNKNAELENAENKIFQIQSQLAEVSVKLENKGKDYDQLSALLEDSNKTISIKSSTISEL